MMRLLKSFLPVGFSLVLFSAGSFSQEKEVFLPWDDKTSPYVAHYPGGEVAWFKTVENKVRYRSFPKGKPLDTISIVMAFIVLRDGTIQEIDFLSGDKRIEQPVRKLLLESGMWIPALQGGRKVKNYRKLKFHFRVDPKNRKWVFDRDASAYVIS